MKTGGTRWVVALLLIAVLGVAGWYLFRHFGEPRYEGQPLSYWFREYCLAKTDQPYHDDDEDKAVEALTNIGTNALPYLLKEAFKTNEDSSFRTNLNEFFKEFPESWRLPRFVTRRDYSMNASGAIRVINPSAGAILPLMQTELAQTNTPSHSEAITILFGVTNGQENLVPYFTKALQDSNQNDQVTAIYALGRIGPKAAAAIHLT